MNKKWRIVRNGFEAESSGFSCDVVNYRAEEQVVGPKVAVLDDSELVVSSMGSHLATFGHHVVTLVPHSTVPSELYTTALAQIVADQHVHILVSDKGFGLFRFDDFAEKIRELSRKTKIILVTGEGFGPEIQLWGALGYFDTFFEKPVTAEVIHEEAMRLSNQENL